MGDPYSIENNKDISIWYSSPNNLLHMNTVNIYEIKGKKPPVIINNIAYELLTKFFGNEEYIPGVVTLHTTLMLGENKGRSYNSYDIPRISEDLKNEYRISLDSGYRICRNG